VGNNRSCRKHGPVSTKAIVKGVEYEPGKVVVFSSAEQARLGAAPNETLVLSGFCPLEGIDPIYFSGQAYYLVPNGHHAQQAYLTAKRAMLEEGVCAVSQIVMREREYFVVVSPVGTFMTLSKLHFSDSIRTPAMFQQEPVAGPTPPSQVQAFKELIRTKLVDRPPYEEHQNPYEERLREAIETKIANQKVFEVARSHHSPTDAGGNNDAAGPRQPLGRPRRAPAAGPVIYGYNKRNKPA
jgi:DNA end-binding protein Ku